MNTLQKFLYMAIGAGILALGIIIGQSVTPGIKAQSNGVFDTIECHRLVIKNTTDDTSEMYLSPDSMIITRGTKKAIQLQSREHTNELIIYYPKTGKEAVEIFSAGAGAGIMTYEQRNQSPATFMISTGHENVIAVKVPGRDVRGVAIESSDNANHLKIYDHNSAALPAGITAFHFLSPSSDRMENTARFYDRKKGKITILKLEE